MALRLGQIVYSVVRIIKHPTLSPQMPRQPKPAASTRDLVSYTPTEVQQLLDLLPKRSPTAKRHRALIAVLFGAGLRVAELVALTPADLEETPSGLLVRIQRGKGSKPRTVPLLAQMRPYVDAWLEARASVRVGRRKLGDDAALFCTLTTGSNPLAASKVRAGQRMSTEGVRAFLRRLEAKAREQLGWTKPLRPHAFRHSYACALADAGVSPVDIQVLLGHASVATTTTYLRTYGRDAAVQRAVAVELPGLK